MPKIAVASGKGGVGKSMLASSLALLFARGKRIVAVDGDVDAPNLHLWLGETEEWDKTEKISTNERPLIDPERCDGCGRCVSICQFGALSLGKPPARSVLSKAGGTGFFPQLNPYLCEGCGACEVVCPREAIRMEAVDNAEIRIKRTRYGFPLVSAQLYPGETGSGKIVDEIKDRAANLDYEVLVLDSPAGTGCPVIAALKDADFVVLVTEPTPSGRSDLHRVLVVVNHFQIPFGVVINKWDIYPALSRRIAAEFKDRLLGKISYDKNVFRAISQLTPVLETDLPVREEIQGIFARLGDILTR